MSPEKSYSGYAEDFTVRVEADRPLLKMATRQVHRALDLGAGTGTGAEDLIDMGIVIEPYVIIGIDLDEDNLKKARENPYLQTHPDSKNKIVFEKGDAEDLIHIPSGSQELVLCRNMIHLTEAAEVLKEIYRVLEPGGVTLISSGYMKDIMYPEPVIASQMRWGRIVSFGKKKLIEKHDYEEDKIPRPNLPDKYDSDKLVRLTEAAGFMNIKTNITPESPYGRVVYLNADALRGLIHWGEFAEGALPIEDVELAKEVLLEALEDPKLVGKKFPRGIFYLKAQKPY